MMSKDTRTEPDRLASLDELSFAITVGEDIQIVINNTEWYIGYDQDGRRVVAQNPDGPIHYIDPDDTDKVLDFVIDGKKIREQWRDIKIVAM